MKDDDLKKIWQENVGKQIRTYSDPDMKSMILKSARKAIGYSYPGILVISSITVLTLFCMLVGLKYAPQTWMYWIVCIIILLIGIGISLVSRRKMQKYSPDTSLKDWLESRIKKFDRDIDLYKKRWLGITYGIGILFLLFFCAVLALTADIKGSILIISFVSGLAVVIATSEINRRLAVKHMVESRKQLQEHYKQLDEQ